MSDELRYSVKRAGVLKGDSHVYFNCPGCDEQLHAPLANAGKPDRCEVCGAAFTLPGVRTLAAQREAEQAEQLAKQAEREKKSKWRATAEEYKRARERVKAREQEREAARVGTERHRSHGDRLRNHAVVMLLFAILSGIGSFVFVVLLVGLSENEPRKPRFNDGLLSDLTYSIANTAYTNQQFAYLQGVVGGIVGACLFVAAARALEALAYLTDQSESDSDSD